MEMGEGGSAPSAAVAAYLAATEGFFATRLPSRSAEQRGADLVALSRAADLCALRFAAEAAAFAETDEYDRQGSVSPIDWLRHQCHLTGPAAADRVCVGNHLEKLPESAEALAAGEIGFGHLAAMARLASSVSESETGRQFDETALLPKAREMSVGRFGYFCLHARHAADPKGVAAEQAEEVENRKLELRCSADGLFYLRGVFDGVGGATLRTALEPLARRSGKDDHRLRERRLADAAVDLAQYALDSGLIPQRASQRAHLQVTTSLETLLGLPGAPAADLEFALPISARTVERLACDASVTRVLLDSESTVIEVGRARRVVSAPLRKALNVRDAFCQWPGCDRSASWTTPHHLKHWIHGGTTDLPNLLLLCYRHHWMVHEGEWQLVKSDDGRMLTVPPPQKVCSWDLIRGPAA